MNKTQFLEAVRERLYLPKSLIYLIDNDSIIIIEKMQISDTRLEYLVRHETHQTKYLYKKVFSFFPTWSSLKKMLSGLTNVAIYNQPKMDMKSFYIASQGTWLPTENTPQTQPDFISNDGSQYWYHTHMLVRRSDHWGHVAKCNWGVKLDKHPHISLVAHDKYPSHNSYIDGVLTPITCQIIWSYLGWRRLNNSQQVRLLARFAFDENAIAKIKTAY